MKHSKDVSDNANNHSNPEQAHINRNNLVFSIHTQTKKKKKEKMNPKIIKYKLQSAGY